MKPVMTCFRYRYKSVAEIAALNAEELIIYKKQLAMQSKSLLDEASEWKHTYKALMTRMHSIANDLEVELEVAYLDRIESDDSDYGSIGFIH